MARISPEEVQHIAKLARLSLDEAEVAAMASDLDHVLEYVAALDELDTSGIEPTAHAIPLDTPLRKDESVAGMDPELAVSNAPERHGTAFSVPKVLAGEER
jgi:aspartyl-tRNA(Asn)/glutamyl-tRNA(Gln) amidotransferase subunit C